MRAIRVVYTVHVLRQNYRSFLFFFSPSAKTTKHDAPAFPFTAVTPFGTNYNTSIILLSTHSPQHTRRVIYQTAAETLCSTSCPRTLYLPSFFDSRERFIIIRLYMENFKLFTRKQFACLNVNFADGFSKEKKNSRAGFVAVAYHIVVDFALASVIYYYMLLYYYIMILFPTMISLWRRSVNSLSWLITLHCFVFLFYYCAHTGGYIYYVYIWFVFEFLFCYLTLTLYSRFIFCLLLGVHHTPCTCKLPMQC